MSRQARRQPEGVEQAIFVEAEEILLVADHRVAERPVEQLDLVEPERAGLRGDLIGDLGRNRVLDRHPGGNEHQARHDQRGKRFHQRRIAPPVGYRTSSVRVSVSSVVASWTRALK